MLSCNSFSYEIGSNNTYDHLFPWITWNEIEGFLNILSNILHCKKKEKIILEMKIYLVFGSADTFFSWSQILSPSLKNSTNWIHTRYAFKTSSCAAIKGENSQENCLSNHQRYWSAVMIYRAWNSETVFVIPVRWVELLIWTIMDPLINHVHG